MTTPQGPRSRWGLNHGRIGVEQPGTAHWPASVKPQPMADRIRARTDALADLLISKNAAYGNSALEPIEVFAHDVDAVTRLCVRMDDKVSRLKLGHEVPDEDTIVDLAGYLILLLLAREDTETSRSDGSS